MPPCFIDTGSGTGVSTALNLITDTSTVRINGSVIKPDNAIDKYSGVTTYVANTRLIGMVNNWLDVRGMVDSSSYGAESLVAEK